MKAINDGRSENQGSPSQSKIQGLLTPPIVEIIWVKNVIIKKIYPENMKNIVGAVWELPAK